MIPAEHSRCARTRRGSMSAAWLAALAGPAPLLASQGEPPAPEVRVDEEEEAERRARFGLAVCASRSSFGEGATLRFAVAAPYGWAPARGALHVFEGTPPRHVRALPGLPGHAVARDIQRVLYEGEEHLLLEGYLWQQTASFIYSWTGEVVHEFDPSSGRPVPVGDVNGDGTTDFCFLGEDGDLVMVDIRAGAKLGVMAERFPGRPLDGLHDQDNCWSVLAWVPGAALRIVRRKTSEEVRVRWRSPSEPVDQRARAESPLRPPALRSQLLTYKTADATTRSRLVLADPHWDWDVGRIAAFDAQTGALVYEIEDVFGIELATGRGSSQYEGSNLGQSLLVGPDIDGDGVPDLFAGSPKQFFGEARVHAFSGVDGAHVWSYSAGPDLTYVGVSMDLVPDYDGDGLPDLLVGGAQFNIAGRPHRVGNVRILSSKTGELLWKFSVDDLGHALR